MLKKGITILLILVVSLCVFTACGEVEITDHTAFIGVYVVTFDSVYDESGAVYTYDVYVQLNPDGTYYFEQTCKDPSMTKHNMSFDDGQWWVSTYDRTDFGYSYKNCVVLKTSFFEYDEDGIIIRIDDDLNLVYRYFKKYSERKIEEYTMKKIQ